jgi:hypothetical protein
MPVRFGRGFDCTLRPCQALAAGRDAPKRVWKNAQRPLPMVTARNRRSAFTARLETFSDFLDSMAQPAEKCLQSDAIGEFFPA